MLLVRGDMAIMVVGQAPSHGASSQAEQAALRLVLVFL